MKTKTDVFITTKTITKTLLGIKGFSMVLLGETAQILTRSDLSSVEEKKNIIPKYSPSRNVVELEHLG